MIGVHLNKSEEKFKTGHCMASDQPRKITDFKELDSFLGGEFILLCGSAISAGTIDNRGVFAPFLPMIGTASERFFFNLHDHLKNDDYLNKVLSKYALELAKGKYKLIRRTRKFEDFLWHLEQVLGVDSVVKLLYSLYYCEPGQFLHNHTAIANLLNKGRVRLCLTTNFDNAIENAHPNITKLVHTQGFAVNSIPDKPTLLKLHGDVIEGSYIATIPKLMAAEETKGFSYLERLIKDKTVLVAGYSGNGDIDIAPHLRKAKKDGARLVWLVKPGDPPSDISTDWFASDLFSLDGDKNCLIMLGGPTNQKTINGKNIKPSWESRLKQWSNTVFSTVSIKQIIDTLDSVSGWASFQLYFINKWDSRKYGKDTDKDIDLLDFGRKCLGIGTYYSALNAMRKIDRENILKAGLYNELLFIKGFSNWRLVRLMEASNTLRHFGFLDETEWLGKLEENAFRVYVQVLQEIISKYASSLDAFNFYYDHQVGDSCRKLLSLVGRSGDPTSKLLGSLVVLDIERVIGKINNIDEYRGLYQKAIDLQIWGVALAASRSILRVNFVEGLEKLRGIHRIAGGAWKWHSIKHNTLAVLDKLPKFIINPAHIANIILSTFPVLAREAQLGFKWILWQVAYRSSIIITE